MCIICMYDYMSTCTLFKSSFIHIHIRVYYVYYNVPVARARGEISMPNTCIDSYVCSSVIIKYYYRNTNRRISSITYHMLI